MTVAGSTRFTSTIAVLVVLLAVVSVLPIVLFAPEPAPLPRIQKTAVEVRAYLDRMFPCPPRAATRTAKEYEARAGCSGSFFVEPRGQSAPLESIEAFIPVGKFENDIRTRLVISPNYGKVARYMFPEWSRAEAWVNDGIAHVYGCPKIAHANGLWIMIRQQVSNFGNYQYVRFLITTDGSEIASWRSSDEVWCDGPVPVYEIP